MLLYGMSKPRIIVLSNDTDDSFRWVSGGWYEMKKRHTARAQELMAKTHAAIELATDVPDGIRRLREAGFSVVRIDDLDPDERQLIRQFTDTTT